MAPLRSFTKIADDVVNAAGDSIGVGKRVKLADLGKKLDDIDAKGGDVTDLYTNKTIKNLDDVADLATILNKSDIPKKDVDKHIKELSKIVKTDSDVMKATKATLAQAKSAIDKASDFIKKNPKIAAAGAGVGGIATLMLIKGESDPAKVIGEQLGSLIEGAADAAGKGIGGVVKGAADASGIGDFFSKFGIYIGIFCAILLVLGLFMMLK